jgi:hypothetical protein
MTTNIGGIKIPELTYPVLIPSMTYYIDTGFLEDYVEIMGLDTDFPAPGLEDIAKQSAVYRSQIYLESLLFVGYKTQPYVQVLQWPRDGVYDKDTVLVDSDQTPYDIFNAIAEGAFLEYGTVGALQPKIDPIGLSLISSEEVSAGSVGVKTSYDTSQIAPAVRNMIGADFYTRLASYLGNWLGDMSGTFVRIARG